MRAIGRITEVGLASASAVVFVREAAAAREENAFLRARLSEVIGGDKVESTEDLVNIKRFLSSSIRWDVRLRNVPRPVLRAPAMDILETGWGFCGENARVAILLLNAGGVPANRLYLEGERWGHVVVEHKWDGRRRLFDAHSDPGTLLPDELVGVIDSRELERFPNRHRENPYRRAYRIRLAGRWPILDDLRLPPRVSVALERPSIIKATCALILTVTLTVHVARGSSIKRR